MDTSLKTSSELLRHASNSLREAGVETPILDAELLLCKASGLTRTQLLTHPEYQPTEDIAKVFAEWVQRRTQREPLPYITGEREFYGVIFHVTPAVLIPRQETEFLVEAAIHALRMKRAPNVIDIGLGSGAIAVTIALNIPEATIYGTDTSMPALEVATANAERLHVADRTIFRVGDLFEPFSDLTFDLVVSNPPYIPSSDIPTLQQEVKNFEPHSALDGGPDGLECYRRLIKQSTERLCPFGVLAVEVGIGEAQDVMRLCEENGFSGIRSIKDYSGIDRVVIALCSEATDVGPGPLVDPFYPELPKEL